jgi:hypothetical protein
MTSKETKAELARKKHSEYLRKQGAHAISVEQVPISGRKQYAVIAMFENRPKTKLPSSLTVKTADGEAKVPLLARTEERFQLQ